MSGEQFRVQSQAKAYAGVIGVTLGMLIAGLIIPLALGRTPAPISATGGATGDLSFTDDSGAVGVPGVTGGPSGALPGGGKPGKNGLTVPGGATLPGGGGGGGVGASGAAGTPGVPGTPGAPSPTATGPLTASDQGVTATTIKLGVILLDIEALKALGFAQPRFTPEEQRESAQVFIDNINKDGGILGRKIVPAYATLNALDSNGEQSPGAVCSRLAEDEKVFAVVGYLNQAADCLTQQFRLPSWIDSSGIAEQYTKSQNFLISPRANTERNGANWGDLAARSGVLDGKTIGTVYLDNPGEARPEAALTAGLAEAGSKVTVHGKLANDPASAQSQMPVVVNQMRQAGVDTVFLSTNFVIAIQFVQTAENQGFRPQYHVSDMGSLTAEGLLGSMPASFGGAIGFTQSTGSKENAADKGCREEFNAATGKNAAPGTDSASIRQFCFWFRTFAASARAVGADLTRTGLVSAVMGLGRVTLPLQIGGAMGSGKTDFADAYRPIRYDRSCKCFRDAGGAQQGRY